MGMFTSIIHPDNRELQIKCGYDDCEVYHLGDEVKWYADPKNPGSGKLLDGVYESWSDKGKDDFVVIQNHRVAYLIDKVQLDSYRKNIVVAIKKLFKHDPEFCQGLLKELDWSFGEEQLSNIYNVHPDRKLWSEDAWDRKGEKELEREIESLQRQLGNRKELNALLKGKPKKKRKEIIQKFVAREIGSAVSHIVDYEGMARRIFTVEKIK